MSASQPICTTIDLLRHGACEGGEIFRGTTDVELSELGWQQMRAAVAPHAGWQRIISSPLLRCQRFAREHADALALPMTIDEDWREINFGAWEGQLITDVWKQYPEEIKQYYSEPGNYTPPGGDNMVDVQTRLIQAWKAALEKHEGEHLLIVQHGGTIRLLLPYLLDAPITTATSFDVGYAAFTRIRVYHDAHRVRTQLELHHPGPK